MKERPILFSAPMVQSLLAGRKTQTRRTVKWQGPKGFPHFFDRAFVDNPAGIQRLCVPYRHPSDSDDGEGNAAHRHYAPYGDPAERLWVRENGWQRPERSARDMREGADTWAPYYYDADGYTKVDGAQFKAWGFKRRPSIHMPRWASRITLQITGVRVERLQDISHIDAIAEGVQSVEGAPLRNERLTVPQVIYAHLWDKINGTGAWDKNPWVWVIEFQLSVPPPVVEAPSSELASIE